MILQYGHRRKLSSVVNYRVLNEFSMRRFMQNTPKMKLAKHSRKRSKPNKVLLLEVGALNCLQKGLNIPTQKKKRWLLPTGLRRYWLEDFVL